MTRYAIGIDTGGTYTDAVVIDAAERRILAKAKALTTKGDLAVGVTEALDRALAESARLGGPSGADVGLVSLSTTLATNAIVEGHGSSIGVILVGFDDAMAARTEIASAIPGVRIARIAGGHDHAGSEQFPLDTAAVEAFLGETAGTVEAYAVAAQWSVRNPAHEHRVRAMVEAMAGRPASLSADLAHALDAPRRALTAALNARIIGRIAALIGAVRRAMAEHGVDAPLMIVKGDGTLAAADVVALRPIETILSGPAASVIGARFLSGLSDFVVSDIGGTTTDVAVLENGWPRLDRTGAVVGGRRTLVRAIDMRTFGLGGDSEVLVDGSGKVGLGANRIVPLSLLASVYPEVLNILRRQLEDPEGEPAAGRFVLRPFGANGAAPAEDLSTREAELLARVGDHAKPYAEVVHGPTQQRVLQRLVGLGRLAIAGLTPSDAAHVLGRQSQWSAEAARFGALVTERRLRMAPFRTGEAADAAAKSFAEEIADAVVAKTGRVILETLAGESLEGARPLVDAVTGGAGRHGLLKVAITPSVPVVAVGGPAPVFYPEVGRRLGADLVLLEHGDVANAVGAAVGVVKVRATVDITSPGVGTWLVHAEAEPIIVVDGTQALELARDTAVRQARERAAATGAGEDVHVEVHLDRVDIPGMEGDRGLVAATIIAECWATPRD